MRRLGIAQKLWAVCLGFGLPVLVMFVLMLQAKLDQIEFADKEMAGDAFQRPLEDVLQHVSRHRRLWARYRFGEGALLPALGVEAKSVSRAIEGVLAAQRKLGDELQFTPHGLAIRQRSDFTAPTLQERWNTLLAGQAETDAPTIAAQYGALVAHVRTMITHAGDTSNLILDPDLDSYYLMDVTLLALPQMEERLQQISHELDLLQSAGQASHEQRMRLASQAAALEEADWGRVVASTKTALNEDRNFYGVSPSLSPRMSPLLAAGSSLATRIVDNLRALAGNASIERASATALLGDLDRLTDLAYVLHRAGFEEEDALLKLRIGKLRADLYLGCSLALAAVLISSLLAFALSSSIVRRVTLISAATQAFSEGKLDARVRGAGTDELGTLANSFDAMAERIERLNLEVQTRAAQLAEANVRLEQTVEARTSELSQRNASFKLILDNAQEGMLSIDLRGGMSSECSAAVQRWLGTPAAGTLFTDYVRSRDPLFASLFEAGLEQLAEDVLPLELALAQLPQHLTIHEADVPVEDGKRGSGVSRRNGRVLHLRARYQPIADGEHISSLLVVLSDVTAELAAQKATAAQEEALRIFHACQRDRAGFLGFVLEARDMVEQIRTSERRASVELTRTIHTLKGNCGLFGVLSVAGLCHEVEHRMAENGGILSREDSEQLVQSWEEVLSMVTQFVGDVAAQKLEVADDEYAALVESIARGTPRRDLLVAIARWRLEPVERHFARFAHQAKAIARRLGKELSVQIEANDLRVCGEVWSPLWSGLAHVMRNAVDHGIETRDERVQRAKPALGTLRLCARQAHGRFVLEISDDGRGVDWKGVAARAKERGLAHTTHRDLHEALFADGISTKDVVTSLSGRGVGMAAVREACRALGGDVEVESVAHAGTLVRCNFPEAAMGGHWVVSAKALPIVESLTPRAV